jgi:uncharacterized protein (TIGR04222 family)
MSGEPWGLSGPEFLRLSVVALLACVALAVVARRRRGGNTGTWGAAPTSELGVYETAYLVGGPQRVALTALVALARQERIRTTASGGVEPVVRAVDRADRWLAPVEQATLSEVEQAPGLKAGHVLGVVRGRDEVHAIARSLESAGLLAAREQRQAWRLPLAPLGVLLAIGLARLVNGVSLGRPVGYLAILLLAALAVLIALWVTVPVRTRAGDDVVEQLKRSAPQTEPAAQPVTAMDGPAVAALAGVALLGLPALAGDDPLRRELLSGGAASSGSYGGFVGGGDGGGGDGGGDGGGGG